MKPWVVTLNKKLLSVPGSLNIHKQRRQWTRYINELQQQFGQEATPKQTFLWYKHKLFATGNIKVKPRSGRPLARGSQCQLFEESVAISPQKLIPKWLVKLGIPCYTMQKHVNVDLKLYCCHPLFIQELTDVDLNCREDMLVRYSGNIGFGHVSPLVPAPFDWPLHTLDCHCLTIPFRAS